MQQQHKASMHKRHTRLLQAYREYSKELAAILSPMLNSGAGDVTDVIAAEDMQGQTSVDLPASPPWLQALEHALPWRMTLETYLSNLFRDWCWGEESGELAEAYKPLRGLLSPEMSEKSGQSIELSGKRMLVLGAGASRLAYEFHQEHALDLTICCDIHPLFLYAAQKITQGRKLTLTEWPLAPIDSASFAVKRRLKAPKPARPGLHFLLTDVVSTDFQPNSFDVVLTPWFIDIIPLDFESLTKSINRVLKPQGLWVNTGSCFFEHAEPCHQHAPEELAGVLSEQGFVGIETRQDQQPYLQCPESAYGRVEKVVSFRASKQQECLPPSGGSKKLPDWLVHLDRPIPREARFERFAAGQVFYGEVAQAIDGKRSMSQLGEEWAERLGTTPEDAVASLASFLYKIWRSS